MKNRILAPMTTLALCVAALAAAAQPLGDPPTFEVARKPIEWETLKRTQFDPSWIVPAARGDDGRDLAAEMRKLVALEFDLPHPNNPERRLRNLGDLAVAAREVDSKRRGAWVESTVAADRKLSKQWGSPMRQLLDEHLLFSKDWDPEENDKADGLYIATGWPLPKSAAPWKRVSPDLDAEQGATFVMSDVTTFKEVENDYAAYPDDVAANYEEINPVPGTYVQGVDDQGQPFSSLRVTFRSDLPFPFGGYSCDLRILNRVREDGEFEAHIYSPSDDFHWMAGRDTFLQVRTSEGAPVGYVVTRVYGFDLDGVPDTRGNRRGALRASLGNLKRKADTRFREGGRVWRDVPGELPEFPVYGLHKR